MSRADERLKRRAARAIFADREIMIHLEGLKLKVADAAMAWWRGGAEVASDDLKRDFVNAMTLLDYDERRYGRKP